MSVWIVVKRHSLIVLSMIFTILISLLHNIIDFSYTVSFFSSAFFISSSWKLRYKLSSSRERWNADLYRQGSFTKSTTVERRTNKKDGDLHPNAKHEDPLLQTCTFRNVEQNRGIPLWVVVRVRTITGMQINIRKSYEVKSEF